jgi:hypothetical protein
VLQGFARCQLKKTKGLNGQKKTEKEQKESLISVTHLHMVGDLEAPLIKSNV